MLERLIRTLTGGSEIKSKNRKKAAMALNLCSVSISRIIDSENVDIMEQEYDAILNNLNLQNIIKDEALLTTMRSILDTISFYRLQHGDKKRLDVRYQHRLNNAIWDTAGSVNFMVLGQGWWTAAAAAVIQVGTAYINYRRSKSAARLEYDEASWRLERSALEQLHALRCSLFETAWRLSDTYNFPDEWRLTIKQIDKYNDILLEENGAWRYAKLNQYKNDFMAYPYFWYELAEAAFQAALENPDNKKSYHDKAEETLEIFIHSDFNLLRSDVIGASAIIRYVQLLKEKYGTWTIALKKAASPLSSVLKLACEAPDLLMNAALFYCAANTENHNPEYAEKAMLLFEMLVNQNYNIPTTSRLLSKLYLENKKDFEYNLLKIRVGDDKVLTEGEDLETIIKPTRDSLLSEIQELFHKQFYIALKIAAPELFNYPADEINEHIESWVKDNNKKTDGGVKENMHNLWGAIQSQLNNQMIFVHKTVGFEKDKISEIANILNNEANKTINDFDGHWYHVFFKRDRIIEQHQALIDLINKFRDDFVMMFTQLAEISFNSGKFLDISLLENAITELRNKVASLIDRNGIKGVNDSGHDTAYVDFFTAQTSRSSKTYTFAEYKDFMSEIEMLIKNQESFKIEKIPFRDLLSTASEIKAIIEHSGKSVRVYTVGRTAIAAGLSLFPATAPVGMVSLVKNLIHSICTYNPDYEIAYYPTSIVVTYKHKNIKGSI